MKKEITNFQYFIFTFVGVFVLSLIAWPLMDLLFSKKSFKYSIISDIVMPFIFSVIYSLIETLIRIKKMKKSK